MEDQLNEWQGTTLGGIWFKIRPVQLRKDGCERCVRSSGGDGEPCKRLAKNDNLAPSQGSTEPDEPNDSVFWNLTH